MPRPPKAIQQPSLASGQASYVIDRMVADRRVSAAEILRYVNEMQTEIGELERRLESLRAAAGGTLTTQPASRRRGRPPGSRNRVRAARRAVPADAPAVTGGRRRRRRSAITPAQL